MRENRKFAALTLVLIIIAWNLSACLPYPARRPDTTAPNNNINYHNPGMQTPYTAQNGQEENNNQISSIFTKLDYSYATITASTTNIRSGPSTKTSVIGTLKSGDRVKVIGKLNNWYVINIPNTSKIGCISPNYTKLYSAQPESTTPAAAKPIPDTNNNAADKNNTVPAENTGTLKNAPVAAGTGALSAQGSRILQLANAERAKAGAKPLKANADLNKLATMKSQDIVEKNYFSHQSPTYGSPFDMMKTYGISYMYAGENLAINQDADGAHNAWMKSEGHKRNILNPDFTEIGIGLYPKGNGSYAYTQMFIGK